MILALRLARRELRGGVRGLRIVLACLALGVAVIAAVGSLREAIDRGLAANGRQLLGGDLSIESGSQPLPAEVRDWLAAKGARVSAIEMMRSILVAPSGERQLIELKAVDGAWPMVGEAVFDPPQPVRSALGERDGPSRDRGPARGAGPARLAEGRRSAARQRAVRAQRRACSPSRTVWPGSRRLRLARSSRATRWRRPAWSRQVRWSNTGCAWCSPPARGGRGRPGVCATPSPARAGAFARRTTPRRGVSRFIDQTGLFMTLVGLTALLVGGIGAANGVRAWLEAAGADHRHPAVPWRLRAPRVHGLPAASYGPGAGRGGAGGGGRDAAAPLAVYLFEDLLPVAPELGLYPVPLGLAAGFGLLTAGAFVLWPLGRAARIPGGRAVPGRPVAGPGLAGALADRS